jgi:hypothetical protein
MLWYNDMVLFILVVDNVVARLLREDKTVSHSLQCSLVACPTTLLQRTTFANSALNDTFCNSSVYGH